MQKSTELLDDAMRSLARLRQAIDAEKTNAAKAQTAAANIPSHIDVEGQSWGSPYFGCTRVTLNFSVHHHYTFWTFNLWKFSFALHVPSRKRQEHGMAALAAWLADERERTFETTLATLLEKKKRHEAIELVRDVRNLTTKQAMEYVDNRITNSQLTSEHLSKLNENVKVNDRIVQEYKEMGGDMPLQARLGS